MYIKRKGPQGTGYYVQNPLKEGGSHNRDDHRGVYWHWPTNMYDSIYIYLHLMQGLRRETVRWITHIKITSQTIIQKSQEYSFTAAGR